MNDFNQIFDEVLKKIKPDDEELNLINKITLTLIELLEQKAKELEIQYTTI